MSVRMALCFLLVFIGIGISQTIWLKSSACSYLKIPLDGGLKWRGRRLLGEHKTIRGFVVIVPFASLMFLSFGLVLSTFKDPELAPWQLTPWQWLAAGALMGSAYMLGELPNSFLKRQMGISEGQRGKTAPQRFFFDLLDETDSIIGALLGGKMLLPIDWTFVAVILTLGPPLHLAFNRCFIQNRKAFPTIYFLLFLTLCISLLLVWPIAALIPRLNSLLIRRFTQMGLWALGIRCQVEGSLRPNVGILLCNHSSWLDQLLLLSSISKPVVFIAHRKYFRVPFLAWVLRRQGAIAKPHTLRAARKVRDSILLAMAQDKLVVIFPEATRSEDGFPLPLHSTLRFLPEHVSWQCCWLSGAHACLPRSESLWRIRPGTLRLHLLDSPACQPPFKQKLLRELWIQQWILDQLTPLTKAIDPKRFGGKAANLALAMTKNFKVPEGVVLPTVIFERMADPLETDFATHLDLVLESWLRQQNSPSSWAVRSSAVGEDGAAYSFAGQLESVLHVSGTARLKESVRQVAWSLQRATAYENLTEHKLHGCAVIIQQQVAARYGGVGFSAMPWQKQTAFIIEYTQGLGEDLVQGRITPGRAWLDRSSGSILSLQDPDEGSCLPHHLLQAIYRLGMNLEQEWQRPIDFEWAIDSNHQLFLLQVRPITSESRIEKFLSNANMNENYPRPVTPFLYSLASRGYQQYFAQLGSWTGVAKSQIQAMEPALRNILGIHQGRLYYDLTAVRSCLGVLPKGSTLIRLWDEFLGIGALDLPLPPPQSKTSSLLLPLVFSLRLLILMLIFPYLALRFRRRVDRVLAQDHSLKDALRAQEQQLQAICQIRFNGWGEAALCDAAVMLYTGGLRALLQLCVHPEQHEFWQARLVGNSASVGMQQLEDMRLLQNIAQSYPPLLRLLEAKAWSTAWNHIQKSSRYHRLRLACEQWLKLWGTRVSGELMLTEKNYHDDPELLMQVLAQKIPAHHHETKNKNLWSFVHAANQYRGWPAAALAALALLLAMPARAAIRAREVCRLSQSRLYGLLRANLLKTGRILASRHLLNAADDVFFLSLDELMGLLSENTYSLQALQGTVKLRREQYQAWQGSKVPERIGRRQGRPLFTRENLQAHTETNTISNSGQRRTRTGNPASAGIAKGRIRILRSTDQGHELQTGEILVTRETDPGWTVALGRASALIVERGGMLSHGAIVARELGIPAVIGLRDITDELQNGMEVEVDGLKGTIQWISGEL